MGVKGWYFPRFSANFDLFGVVFGWFRIEIGQILPFFFDLRGFFSLFGKFTIFV